MPNKLPWAYTEAVGAISPTYGYTPTQARIVELYDYYRSALMSAKYYGRKIELLKRIALAIDIGTALAASGSFAGLAIWKSDIGRNAFSLVLGCTAILSALRPVLRLPDKIGRYSKLFYGYMEVFYRIQALTADIRAAGRADPEHLRKAADTAERFRALELEGDAYQDSKKLLKYQDEVDVAIPVERLWLPSE
jgi:hypothetical protein